MGTFHLASDLGVLGEDLGCRYLSEKGYKIVARNYCNIHGRRLGEVDIVAEKSGELIFIEVKSRLVSAGQATLPEASINRNKLRKLERIAQCYLREKRCEQQPYRFDALAILYDAKLKKADIRHLDHIYF